MAPNDPSVLEAPPMTVNIATCPFTPIDDPAAHLGYFNPVGGYGNDGGRFVLRERVAFGPVLYPSGVTGAAIHPK